MPISVMQLRMEIGKFYNYSTKDLKGVKHNGLNISLKIKSFLKFVSFFYTLINFILRFTLFVSYYPLYQCFTILKEIFIVFRNHLSNIFIIVLVYLLYHIRLSLAVTLSQIQALNQVPLKISQYVIGI